MGADSEHEEEALPALDHLRCLRDGDLLGRVGPAGGQDGGAELGREPLGRIREPLEAPLLRQINEVIPMAPDAGRPGDPLRHLHGGACLLRDREPEKDQVHVEGHGEVAGTGYDAPVGLPEVLVVGIVETDGGTAASHRAFLLRPTMAYASPSRKIS